MVPMTLSNKNLLLAAIALVVAIFLSSCAPYQARRTPQHYRTIGTASWYGPGFHGHRTSNGERYDQHDLTAAHRSLPFGSNIRVTNMDNGKAVVVRINDRGPFVRGRIIDLSKAAAQRIDMLGTGTARVELASLNADKRDTSSEETSQNDNGSPPKKRKTGKHQRFVPPPRPPADPPPPRKIITTSPRPTDSRDDLQQMRQNTRDATGMPAPADVF